VDHLDFLEEYLFYEYDHAYRQLTVDGLPVRDDVRAFEQALETVTALRRAYEGQLDDQLRATANATLDELDSDAPRL
jgi:hypothetical protein